MLTILLIVICIFVGLIWFTAKMDSSIESSFRPSGKLTPVEGGIIHWQKQGNGSSLVLIHGLLGNSNNFNELAKTLAQRYTVYSVDRPGSGFSSRYKNTSASFEQQSKMLLEWMEKEGIEKASIAGHSMGGGIALRMAIDAPNVIESVSLLCPLTTPLKGGAGPLSILYIPNEFVRNSVAKTIASPLGQSSVENKLRRFFIQNLCLSHSPLKEAGCLRFILAVFMKEAEILFQHKAVCIDSSHLTVKFNVL